jgi:inositol oxygenase
MEFMNEHDHAMLAAVRAFNPYDLYSKSDEVPSVGVLKVWQITATRQVSAQVLILTNMHHSHTTWS